MAAKYRNRHEDMAAAQIDDVGAGKLLLVRFNCSNFDDSKQILTNRSEGWRRQNNPL